MPYRNTNGFEPKPELVSNYPACMKVFDQLEEIVDEEIHTIEVSTIVYRQVARACHHAHKRFYKISAYFDQPSLTLWSIKVRKNYRIIHNKELSGWNIKPMP